MRRTSKGAGYAHRGRDQELVGEKTMGKGWQAIEEKEGERMVHLREEQKIQTLHSRMAGRLLSSWATHSLQPLCHHTYLS